MHRHEIPHPPKGYYCAATFQYPERFAYIAKSPAAIILCVFYVRAGLDQDVFHGAARLGPGIFIFMIAVFISTDFIDRLIQRKVSRLLGYDTSLCTLLDAFLPGTYTAALGQFQSRRDVLLIAIAPLGLFLLLWIPLLFGLLGIIGDLLSFFSPGQHGKHPLGSLFYWVVVEKTQKHAHLSKDDAHESCI